MVFGFADDHVPLKMTGLVSLGYFTRGIAGEGSLRASAAAKRFFSRRANRRNPFWLNNLLELMKRAAGLAEGQTPCT